MSGNLDNRITKIEASGKGPKRYVAAFQLQDDENLFKLQDTGEIATADELASLDLGENVVLFKVIEDKAEVNNVKS
jgi:hypothetical protein